MRFVPQLLATLALGTVLGAIGAPVNPKVDTDMLPSDLAYADAFTYREGQTLTVRTDVMATQRTTASSPSYRE